MRLGSDPGRPAVTDMTDGVSRRVVLLTGLASVGALTLSACGGGREAPVPDASPGDAASGTVTVAPDGTQEVTLVVRDDYDFYPASFTVTTGRVRLTLTSEAEQLTHNIRFTPGAGPAPIGEEIPIVAPGASDTMEFAVQQAGDYQYECSFHVALGQIGMMTVTPP